MIRKRDDKVAVVTGATDRPRPSHRPEFAAEGATVFITASFRGVDGGVEVTRGRTPSASAAISSKLRDLSIALRRGPQRASRIDIVVANAGGARSSGRRRGCTAGGVRQTFATTSNGDAVHPVQKALPLRRDGARII
jgi:NAD(P)-dependent dehydrogenase (short-subunit alcohol dehydrogenase family)